MNESTRSSARWLLAVSLLSLPAALATSAVGCGLEPIGGTPQPLCDATGLPRYVVSPSVLVAGAGVTNKDCRTGICRHNENTDLTRFHGDVFLVHRSAMSQILGPNSALHVYRSKDEGKTFKEVAVFPAVDDRDIRDPIFYQVGGHLFIKAITRVNGFAPRDEDVKSVSIALESSDGEHWENKGPIGPEGWGFWRITEHQGTLYSAAYQDGDRQVVLFQSTDGLTWKAGAQVYGGSADTPLETELVITPKGRMLGIIRTDGTDDELLGDKGRLRSKLCWADAPYTHFDCPRDLDGQRLDGARHFWHDGRLFVVARKHLQPTLRKRTSIFELTGDFEGGPLTALEWAELPSGGDTSYAGVVRLDDPNRYLISWYSGAIASDPPWPASMLSETDVWTATFDASLMPAAPPTEAECPRARKDPPPDPPAGDCHALTPDLTAFCGYPCDTGNVYGVGEYCSTAGGECGDNQGATICSDVLNGSIGADSHYCTELCDLGTDCGPDAACQCAKLLSGGQICGCTPNACVVPPDVLSPTGPGAPGSSAT